ncbi:hypothetical protein CLIB1444_02S07030 [[Candida] jaroonii]|uniref:Uncharacterized protein n=1 Tax=[Candida] jaroonii TaxID=467808 RepID=A0ACA9Y359_9ASCO|nr:hypothetical protein CLIB1444_02S07030 [[Candida] jaroonii]
MSLSYDPDSLDKKTYFIGGMNVNVYNVDALNEYVKSFDLKESRGTKIPVHILYLVHGRTRSARASEAYGYNVFKRYMEVTNNNVPLVFVTFDVSNHGARIVDRSKNLTWDEGNETHGIDQLSIIDQTLGNLRTIIEYLPGYLNLDIQFAENDEYKLEFVNILSGVSLGGHVVLRMASKFPQYVDILNPVISCSNLSSMSLDRLLKIPPTKDTRRYLMEYKELNLDLQQRKMYPKSFHELLKYTDIELLNNFPYEIPMFAAYGVEDKLVPYVYSEDFLIKYGQKNPLLEVFQQEDKGHEVSIEMCHKFAEWLAEILAAYTKSI